MQQAFHPSLFTQRTRSASLGSKCTSSVETVSSQLKLPLIATDGNHKQSSMEYLESQKNKNTTQWQNDKSLPYRKKRKETSPTHNKQTKKPKHAPTYEIRFHTDYVMVYIIGLKS